MNFLRKSESASAFGPVQVRQAGRRATPTATRPRSHLIKYDKAALGPGKKLSASISLVWSIFEMKNSQPTSPLFCSSMVHIYIYIYVNKMFTLNFGNLGRKDKQKQQWAAAVGYLVAIVAALVVAPFCCCLDVVAAGESTGRTTTTRRCCQRKDEGRRTRGGKCPWVGEELQTTENNRYEQTFLYLWVRGGGGQHDVWGCCTYIMSYAKWCPLGILEKFLSVFSHFAHVLLSGLGRFRCVNGMGVTSCIKGSRLL